MLNYVKEILERTEMQQITEFMRYGVDCMEIKKQTTTYTERIDMAHHAIDERIRSTFPNMHEHEEIISLFDDNIMEIKNAYMEIGIKCGARLIYQLLAQDEDLNVLCQTLTNSYFSNSTMQKQQANEKGS